MTTTGCDVKTEKVVERMLKGVDGVESVVVERRGDVVGYNHIVVTMEYGKVFTSDHRNVMIAMAEVVKAIKEYEFEIISIEELEDDFEHVDVTVVVGGKHRQVHRVPCGTSDDEIRRAIQDSMVKFVDTRDKVFAGMKPVAK